jgi:hypothetical protein
MLVWLAALSGLWVIALYSGHGPWHPATWAHWDSGHYVEIARSGYELHRCGSVAHATWCGNTAWFPGYPLLMAGLHVLGVPLLAAGVALSWLFSAAALLLLWRLFLGKLPALAAIGGLLYAGWAPGQVYDYAVYPLSMLLVFTVAFLYCLGRRRWLLAGLAGACAALTYPLGVTLALAAAVWITLARQRHRVWAIVLSCGPPLLALLAVLSVQWIQTGRWTAYFDVERTYEHGLHDPIGAVTNALILWGRTQSFETENVKGLQTLIVSAVLLAVLLHAIVRRRNLAQFDLLVVIWALVTWAVPLTQGNISVQRSQAALAAIAVLVARLPRTLLVASVVLAVAISVPVASLYFDGLLI